MHSEPANSVFARSAEPSTSELPDAVHRKRIGRRALRQDSRNTEPQQRLDDIFVTRLDEDTRLARVRRFLP